MEHRFDVPHSEACKVKEREGGGPRSKAPTKQRFILGLPHLLFFLLAFVLEAQKVKDAMGHDPMELFLGGSPMDEGIFADPFDGYEKVSADDGSGHVIEGDDVGEILLAEMFFVDLLKGSIGTKDDVELADLLVISMDQLLQSAGTFPSIEQLFGEGKVLGVEFKRPFLGAFQQVQVFCMRKVNSTTRPSS